MIKMIETNRDIIENVFKKIRDSKNIEGLLNIYQQILHNRRYLSPFHLEKTKIFINKLYFPILLLDNEIIKKFNNDPSQILRLKILLTDLYEHSQSKSNYISQSVKNE